MHVLWCQRHYWDRGGTIGIGKALLGSGRHYWDREGTIGIRKALIGVGKELWDQPLNFYNWIVLFVVGTGNHRVPENDKGEGGVDQE